MTIGEQIKYLREQKNWSQEDLATKIGVTQDSISLWENNRRTPNTPYVIALCNIFEVSTDFLLGYENDFNIKKFEYTTNSDLTTEELRLLHAFRSMSQAKRQALFSMLDIDLPKQDKKNIFGE